MAPQKKSDRTSNRRRNRKARTEVSSDSSSSSSESEAGSPPPPSQGQDQKQITSVPKQSGDSSDEAGSGGSGSSPEPVSHAPSQPLQSKIPDQHSFEQFYLTQATKEFANDLDKLRNAGDFRGVQSVEMLVRGLRQGVACFREGERGGAGGAAGG